MMYARGQYVRAFGSEVVKIAPVTLPALQFLEKGPPVDDEPERREVADKFAEFRTIRAGVECWQAISTVNTFAAWTKIAKSLQVGRQAALRATGANRPAGQIYCKAFSAWIDQHGFNGIEKSVRSAALDLLEHLAEIESFPATLRERRIFLAARSSRALMGDRTGAGGCNSSNGNAPVAKSLLKRKFLRFGFF
jgi:hypothetical protein